MNEAVQFERIDLMSLPPFEMSVELEQSLCELSIVRDGRPFTHQTLEALRCFLHKTSAAIIANRATAAINCRVLPLLSIKLPLTR
jgi:hypothetical protein